MSNVDIISLILMVAIYLVIPLILVIGITYTTIKHRRIKVETARREGRILPTTDRPKRPDLTFLRIIAALLAISPFILGIIFRLSNSGADFASGFLVYIVAFFAWPIAGIIFIIAAISGRKRKDS